MKLDLPFTIDALNIPVELPGDIPTDPPVSREGRSPNLPTQDSGKQRGPVRHFRAIFISDIHLGTRDCNAGALLDFLRHTESELLYLVGDIVDAWRLKQSWYWPQSHNDVVQKILRKARKGTRVIFIPGNHDASARDFVGHAVGGVAIADNVTHELADGRRFLVMHGDGFDAVMVHARWLAHLGDYAYTLALWLNRQVNWVRAKLGYPYYSLSAYLKHKVKNAVSFISSFESAIAEECARRKLDGVICGHIHHAEIRQFGDVTYCNDGDWVESCTALVEKFDGTLEILRWQDELAKTSAVSANMAAA